MTIANHDRRRAIRLGIFVTVVILALIWLGASAQAQKVRSEEETARILALEKVTVRDGVVSGEVRNKANHPVRDVQLFVRYTWLWDDERNPGNIDPGTSTYYAVKETIHLGKNRLYLPPSPPLPKIAGGEDLCKNCRFYRIIPQNRNRVRLTEPTGAFSRPMMV
jgi:hypothetical protein